MSTLHEEYDLLEIERYWGSNRFTIPTRQILNLKDNIEEWISMNACGGIVYGNSRSGKTRAIYYITEQLKKKGLMYISLMYKKHLFLAIFIPRTIQNLHFV